MTADLLQRVLDRAVAVQQIPAPTFAEAPRAAYVREQFQAEGLADIQVDELHNVYARLPGSGSAPPLVVSAHTDTVFPAATDLTLTSLPDRIAGPGIGDNSLGVAGLFGILWALERDGLRLPGDLWLVANVGEEGLGDLVGMRAVVDRFEDRPLAYVVLEGMTFGHVYHRGLGVRRHRITTHTAGGHSWGAFGNPSAIHELAALVTRLVALPLPQEPRTTLNVGSISGGLSVNSIAPEASLELDLRSEDLAQLENLDAAVHEMVRESIRPGVQVTIEQVGERPVGELPSTHPLVSLAVNSLKARGEDPNLNIGSTDANIPLSRGYPSICIGLTTGEGAHTTREFILTAPLEKGLSHVIEVVRGVYRVLT